MALIAKQDFHKFSSKRIGEIVNSCINDLEIKAHTLKRDMIMNFLRESVFEACLYTVKQLRHPLNIYCSYLALIKARYWIFRHPFLKHLAYPYFWSDSIENLYSNSKCVEIVWYEVSCGYAALIQIYDFLKVVQFFLDKPIYAYNKLERMTFWTFVYKTNRQCINFNNFDEAHFIINCVHLPVFIKQ